MLQAAPSSRLARSNPPTSHRKAEDWIRTITFHPPRCQFDSPLLECLPSLPSFCASCLPRRFLSLLSPCLSTFQFKKDPFVPGFLSSTFVMKQWKQVFCNSTPWSGAPPLMRRLFSIFYPIPVEIRMERPTTAAPSFISDFPHPCHPKYLPNSNPLTLSSLFLSGRGRVGLRPISDFHVP